MMIEPTESEPQEEFDLFIEAMSSIAEEVRRIPSWCSTLPTPRDSAVWTKPPPRESQSSAGSRKPSSGERQARCGKEWLWEAVSVEKSGCEKSECGKESVWGRSECGKE